jgi:hypothetical protein
MSAIREKLARAKARGFSRRAFLKASVLAGAALGIPSQLASCRSNRSPGPTTSGRTVHVDLSQLGSAATGLPLLLHVGAQSYPLQAHTQQSRDAAQLESARLADISDSAITHYATGVVLSDENLEALRITEGDPSRDPNHHLLFSAQHIPDFAIRNYREYLHEKSGGVGAPPTSADLEDLHTYLCWVDCAVSFVFQHPELANLDPDLATIILAHIDQADPAKRCSRSASHSQEILDLAREMALESQSGGYCVAEPLTQPDGSPLYWTSDGSGARRLIRIQDGAPYLVTGFDADGQPRPLLDEADPSQRTAAVTYRPTGAVLDKAKAAVFAALRLAKDDPDLEGVCWSSVEGSPPIDHDEPPLTAAPLTSDGTHVALDHKGGHDGLSMQLTSETLSTDGNGVRTATLKVRNYYQRYVGVFARWLDANGGDDTAAAGNYGSDTAFGRPAWHADVDKAVNHGEKVFFLGLAGAVTSFMGVPEPPDWVEFTVSFPTSSSKVEIIFASLGEPFSKYRWSVLPGGILTGIINVGIPGYFLYSSIDEGPAGKALLNKAIKSQAVLEAVVFAGLAAVAYGALGDPDQGLNLSCAKWAHAVGPILVSSGCDALRYAVVAAAGESESERAIPFFGQALWLAGLAALASDLVQTTAEILASDAVYVNRASLTWSPTLRLLPDPLDLRGGFPETATRYEVSLQLEGRGFQTWKGAILDTAVDHLDLTFPDIPNGGFATWIFRLYAGKETLVGYVQKQLANWDVQADGSGSATPDQCDYTLQLEEKAVPLTESTTYWHKDKIGVEDGAHRWLATEDAQGRTVSPPAPTATRQDLSCDDAGTAMCAALGLTINQRAHAAAYVWQSAGSATVCGGSATASQMRAIQSLSLTLNGHPGPDGFLRSPGCRYRLPGLAAAYALMDEADGYHAFVEPVRLGAENAYLVRRLKLDATLAFGGSQAVARLASPPDAVAIHPEGYLLALDRDFGKIEIADLDADPVPDAEAPPARLAGGTGIRAGLLRQPVALAVRSDGVVLVLEAGNRRVSAFDAQGSLLKPFATGATFSLADETGTIFPLDIAVEGAHYVYVLSCVNGGVVPADYRVDIYQPDGSWLARTTGLAAARLAVDHFRNLITLNYETVVGPQGTEPTLSLWVPSVPT